MNANATSRAQPTIHDWIRHLRAVAGEPDQTPHMVGPTGFLRFMGAEHQEREPVGGIDESLWNCIADDSPLSVIPDPAGPLHRQLDSQAIELWTERELSAVHALWRWSINHGDASQRARAHDAASWHIANTQPDNATNHPWAIPVFLDLWQTAPDTDEGIDARLYAETQLHNCRTQTGSPDPLSALILRDASNGLQSLFGSG